jgi:hypothetical protein
MFALSLVLGADDEDIENQDERKQEGQWTLQQGAKSSCIAARAWSLRKGRCNEHRVLPSMTWGAKARIRASIGAGL